MWHQLNNKLEFDAPSHTLLYACGRVESPRWVGALILVGNIQMERQHPNWLNAWIFLL
jgi:hypothetical protein